MPNCTSDGCIWKIVCQPLRKNIPVRSIPPIHRQNTPSSSPRQQDADKRCLCRQHNIVLVFSQIFAGKRTAAAKGGRNPVRIPKLIVDRWADTNACRSPSSSKRTSNTYSPAQTRRPFLQVPLQKQPVRLSRPRLRGGHSKWTAYSPLSWPRMASRTTSL